MYSCRSKLLQYASHNVSMSEYFEKVRCNHDIIFLDGMNCFLHSTIPVQSCPTLAVHAALWLLQAAWPDTQEFLLLPLDSW